MAGSSGVPQLVVLKRQFVGRGFGYGVFTALGVLRAANEAFPRRISLEGPSHEKIGPMRSVSATYTLFLPFMTSILSSSNDLRFYHSETLHETRHGKNQLYKAPRVPGEFFLKKNNGLAITLNML